MSKSWTVPDVLEREFPEIRARLLQVAAQLDRLDRATAESTAARDGVDSRLTGIAQSLAVLAGAGPGRAEKIQLIFSREYEADWRRKLEVGVGAKV